MADPDLQIRVGGWGGGGRHPDPEIRRGHGVIRWQAIPVNDSSGPEAVFVRVTGWLKWDKFQWMRCSGF